MYKLPICTFSDRDERIFVYIPKVLGKRPQHFASFTRRRINVRKEKYRTVRDRSMGNKPADEQADRKHRTTIDKMNYSLSYGI